MKIDRSSDLIKEIDRNKKKSLFPWETIEIGQSFFPQYDQVKSLGVLRVMASKKGHVLGKVFRAIDTGTEYEVALLKVKEKEYWLYVPELGYLNGGKFKSGEIEEYRTKEKNYLDNYRKKYKIPITIKLVLDIPHYRSSAGNIIEVSLDEVIRHNKENNINIEQIDNIIKPVSWDQIKPVDN